MNDNEKSKRELRMIINYLRGELGGIIAVLNDDRPPSEKEHLIRMVAEGALSASNPYRED